MKLLFLYLFIINAVCFLLMLSDKRRAIKNRWRIPEATLMFTAAIGGSLGGLLSMRLFRHKTKHLKFSLGLPALLIVHILLLIYFLS
jgi:uncharacterized membrane protein YsdA (DUF1294 family)